VLNQESGELGLGDHGELGVSAADVSFPVRVLRRVGCWWVVNQKGVHSGVKFQKPLLAGVEYFSGREPGGGCRFMVGRGRPLDIAGSTATALPILEGWQQFQHNIII
jgi:hypothetical protein